MAAGVIFHVGFSCELRGQGIYVTGMIRKQAGTKILVIKDPRQPTELQRWRGESSKYIVDVPEQILIIHEN